MALTKKCNIRSKGVGEGSHDLLLEFWDPTRQHHRDSVTAVFQAPARHPLSESGRRPAGRHRPQAGHCRQTASQRVALR